MDVQQTIPWGTPQNVRDEARLIVDTFYRPGEGRLIIGAGNGINEDCPIENLEAFLDEALVYGKSRANA
jgi:uroporphyrinogen decarboxylase